MHYLRNLKWVSLVVATVALSTQVSAEEAAEPDHVSLLTVGARQYSEDTEGYMDVLIPIRQYAGGLFFVNPRAVLNNNEEKEINIGVGCRHLFADRNMVLGANVYYDSRWTTFDNQFDQLGFGLEFMSKWIEARANCYLTEDKEQLAREWSVASEATTVEESIEWEELYTHRSAIYQHYRIERITTTDTLTQYYQQYEKAYNGFDGEIGLLLPLPAERLQVRLFGGYYYWDNGYGDELEGAKSRLEVRFPPFLTLDAEYFEDKQFDGSDYFVGTRLTLPFDLGALASGKNPFAADKYAKSVESHELYHHLTEMVMRDPKIRTSVLVARRDESRTQAETSTTTSLSPQQSEIVLRNVTFVDGDNVGDPAENGTKAHPYDLIQEGVDNANSPVFVFDSALPYMENVVIADGVDVYGQGTPLGFDGRTLGRRVRPVVDGANIAPTFTMGNNTTVSGFEILNTDDPALIDTDSPLLDKPEHYYRMGVYAQDVANPTVFYNTFSDNTHGFYAGHDLDKDFQVTVHHNTFIDNDFNGIVIKGDGNGGNSFSTAIYANDFTRNRNGARVDVFDFDSISVSMHGNSFEDNLYHGGNVSLGGDVVDVVVTDCSFSKDNYYHGFRMDVTASDSADFTFTDNSIEGGYHGLRASFMGSAAGTATMNISDNIVDTEYGKGMYVSANLFANIDMSFLRNTVTDSGTHGMHITGYSYDDMTLYIADNDVSDSGVHGTYVQFGGAFESTRIEIDRNDWSRADNHGLKMDGSGSSASGELTVLIRENTANDTGAKGMRLDVDAGTANVQISDFKARDNSYGGIYADVRGNDGDSTLSITDADILRPGGAGLRILGGAADKYSIYLDSVSVTDGTRSGINLSAGGDEVLVDAQGVVADGNHGCANISMDINGTTSVDVMLQDVSASDADGVNGWTHDGVGIYVDVDNLAGTTEITGQNVVAANNNDNGLEINGNSTAPNTVIDLGGGPDSTGLNSFYGNALYGVVNIGTGMITIDNNYWGGAAPVGAVVTPADYNTAGIIVPTTWLAVDPN